MYTKHWVLAGLIAVAGIISVDLKMADAERPFVPPRGVPTPDAQRAANNPYYGLRSSYSSVRNYYRSPPPCPEPRPRRQNFNSGYPVYNPYFQPYANPYYNSYAYPYGYQSPFFRRF